MDFHLNATDNITQNIKNLGITEWNRLAAYIQNLPYGRNANRGDFSLVLSENKGSCSSKHGLLKTVADLNNIPKVELMIGIYKMNETNTPKILPVLSQNKLKYLSEAHCYLKINGDRNDFTSATSDFRKIENDILEEIEIEAHQVSEFKVEFHKKYLKNWLLQEALDYTFEEVWKVREKCIQQLENSKRF